ncbi:DEAD/DEAH box helicase [Kitasatospora sp. NPDC059722]|uniref:DEAD/DEAH box helicase n=1 Tax=Kitasatospora sp. NPDC059722 TaxID=3346925 RepID=UPI0036988333
MTAERRRRAAVVGYWRAVELFSPQKVPAASLRERVYEVSPDRPLPWQDGHPLRRLPLEPGFTWQHVVYGGVFPLSAVRDALLEVFGEDDEDHDGRMAGESALFALTVNDEGRLLLDSPIFSTCAWATGRARRPGPGRPGWLDGFDGEAQSWHARAGELGEDPVPVLAADGAPAAEALTAARALLAEGTDGPDDGADGSESPVGTRHITAADLLGFASDLADDWSVAKDLAPFAVRVRSVQVRSDRADDVDQQDFLNSFIAADLDRVTRDLALNDPGQALGTYLAPAAAFRPEHRIDLRHQPEQALVRVSPAAAPPGRWPASTKYPLALSQQFAVNLVGGELTDSAGVFAVNGPPGTGKTTMLRDIVAHLVVERATRLARLRLPSAAFSDTTHQWKSGEYSRTVRELRAELTGFEMVVASANNGAVENISTEIPSLGAVHEDWHAQADYFAEQATRLLKGEPAWGAIAARLGSKRNRGEFVSRFWWGQEKASDTRPDNGNSTGTGTGTGPDGGPRAAARPSAGRTARRDGWIDTGRGLQHLLAEYAASPQSGVWRAAVDRFRSALATVERLGAERAEAAEALSGLPAARAAAEAAARAVRTTAEDLRHRQEDLAGAARAAAEAQRRLEDCERERQAHFERRPGFTVSLFTAGRAARDWHAGDAPLAEREQAARLAADGARDAEQRAGSAAHLAETALHHHRVEHADAVERAERLESTLATARARWGDRVPSPELLAESERRELSSPWADEEITAARTEVFFAAMEVHKAFLRCTAKTMRANLRAAMDVVSGAAPKTVPEEARRAAWQSLFLVVPLVSTTFASLDRVFSGLGRESLGWLFIDEAGQATPQMAVGGLWRARRSVVVGDPLQLEPVVVLPWTAQQALRRDFGVDEEWAPSRTSVQRVADRANRYGTTLPAELPDGSTEVWVGAPLRVHRRCDDPMFAVSNAIAYDGLMVHGTPDRGAFPYAGSSWVDVASPQAEGHWIPEEGRALRQIVEKLLDRGVSADDIFVISPFRDVVAGAQRVTRGLLDRTRVGTVHTTQGKESDVVILVLGTDPRHPGARGWAASRPNLLNVAVSRARRRLFVIGNRDAWRDQRFFNTLADALPTHVWHPPR